MVALGIRSFLFVASSFVVFSFHSSVQSVEFFQLILFQSIIISFCSAASQNQLIKKDNEEKVTVKILSGYLNIATLAALISVVFIMNIEHPSYDKNFMIITAVGGAFAAAGSALMGITRKDFGDPKAFLLSSVTCIPSIILILTLGTDQIAFVYIAILISQIFNFTAQATVVRSTLKRAFLTGFLRLKSIVSPISWDILLRGISNIIIVLGIFFWREEWVKHVSDDFSSLVFFLFRLGDIALQILVMMFIRINLFGMIMENYRQQYISAYLLVTILLFGILGFMGGGDEYIIWTVLCVHLLFEIHRLSMAMTYNYQASQPKGSTYFLYQVLPISAAIGISYCLTSYQTNYGIYIFMGIISTMSFIITFRHHSKNRRSTG